MYLARGEAAEGGGGAEGPCHTSSYRQFSEIKPLHYTKPGKSFQSASGVSVKANIPSGESCKVAGPEAPLAQIPKYSK